MRGKHQFCQLTSAPFLWIFRTLTVSSLISTASRKSCHLSRFIQSRVDRNYIWEWQDFTGIGNLFLLSFPPALNPTPRLSSPFTQQSNSGRTRCHTLTCLWVMQPKTSGAKSEDSNLAVIPLGVHKSILANIQSSRVLLNNFMEIAG